MLLVSTNRVVNVEGIIEVKVPYSASCTKTLFTVYYHKSDPYTTIFSKHILERKPAPPGRANWIFGPINPNNWFKSTADKAYERVIFCSFQA